MKRLVFFLLALCCAGMAAAEGFALVRNGKAQCMILLPPKPSAGIYRTVSRFNQTLETITGTTLRFSTKKTDQPRIAIKLHKAKKQSELDHFTITFPDAKTMQIQATSTSLQWAFNHLIRKFANAEWILVENCGLSYTPMKDLIIPKKKIVVNNVSWPIYRTNTHMREWWKLNFREQFRVGHDLTYHAFPSSKYNKNNSWPEAIMPVLNGKKIKAPPNPKHPVSFWQPCYSNPETARIAVKNLLEYLKKRPGQFYISLGCNDNNGYCECAACMKMDKKRVYNRSESYFTFINRVLEGVCKKYPDLIVSVFAYARTYEPPSFKLHKNAFVVLCIDFHSCVAPRMYAKHKKAILEWGKKASMLGVWDYSWGFPYPAPRLYAPYHLDMLKLIYKNNGRGYGGESFLSNAAEGPKQYLIAKFLWDSNQDMKKVEEDWYIRCVGKKAAPYLKAYFKVWNDYFTGRVKNTPWFKSVYNTYASFGNYTCVYGLLESDFTAAQKAMDKVVALAETPQEKERAELMMLHCRYTLLRVRMLGAGIYNANGSLSSADQALKLLDLVKKYPENQKKYDAISQIFCKGPDKVMYLNKYYQRTGGSPVSRDFYQPTCNHIIAASLFSGDPRIRARMRSIADDPRQSTLIRQLCKALADPTVLKNMLPGGDAEGTIPAKFEIHPQLRKTADLSISSARKASGRKSFLVDIKGHNTLLWIQADAKPNRTYLATFKAFIATPSAEGYLLTNLYAQRKGVNQQYRTPSPLKLSGGTWQTFSVITTTLASSDSIRLRIRLLEFDKGDKIYFDEIRLMDIGPAPARKK